jgi:uncharacterized protein (DUF1778 family)
MMAIGNSRDRVITFRLSSREYQAVFGAAEIGCARSISDYARTAVLDRAQFVEPIDSERVQLRLLMERSARLYELLLELSCRLATEQPPIAKTSD